MSEYPLFELLLTQPERVSPMQAYLRDTGRTHQQVDERRKDDLRRILADFKNGRHPALVLLSALETIIGAEHNWSNWATVVRDEKYFEDRLRLNNQAEPGLSPEEKKTEYMQKAEALIHENLGKISDQALNSPRDLDAWIDRLLADFNDYNAIEIVILMVKKLRKHEEKDSEYGKAGLIGSLQKQLDYEDRQNSVHPHDEFIEGDLFQVLLTHRPRKSRHTERSQDKYETEDGIEIRRLTELIKILEDWKAGAHPLHIVNDAVEVGIDSIDSPYRDLFEVAQSADEREREARKDGFRRNWSEYDREENLVRILQTKECLRLDARDALRNMRTEAAAYRGSEHNPEFAMQIDSYIDHIKSGSETSLDIIRNLAETIILSKDDLPDLTKPILDFDNVYIIGEEDDDDEKENINYGWSNLGDGEEEDMEPGKSRDEEDRGFSDEDWSDFHARTQMIYFHKLSDLSRIILRLDLKKKQEEAYFKAHGPMPALPTQSETEAREKLTDIFARRAPNAPEHKSMIGGIHIEPSGSGTIKVFRGPFDDERYSGAPIARITTYSVNLVPADPSMLTELAERVHKALKNVAHIEASFKKPVEYDAGQFAYKRPFTFVRERNGYFEDGEWVTKTKRVRVFQNCGVIMTDGQVRIETRLDLDDVWNLYYLLEDIIEPNAQIAQAMDRARYAEERGLIEDKIEKPSYLYGDEDEDEEPASSYSNTVMGPTERMGSLEGVDPADYLMADIDHTLSLYAIGEIGEEQLLQRTLELAEHTLQGRLLDPFGLLPSFSLLEDQSKQSGHAVITYKEALTERTRDLLRFMAGTEDANQPLFPALIAKAAELGPLIRKDLRRGYHDKHVEDFERAWDRMRNMKSRDPAEILDVLKPKTKMQEAWDNLDTAKRKAKSEEKSRSAKSGEDPAREIAASANLTLRSPDVGHTSNRSWRGTDYVSRQKDSLWVRKDLPAALAKFIQSDGRPDMRAAMRMITSEHGLK